MSRATETVVASQASVTSAGESLMATAWAAARCMGISFHESPTLQISMLSPE